MAQSYVPCGFLVRSPGVPGGEFHTGSVNHFYVPDCSFIITEDFVDLIHAQLRRFSFDSWGFQDTNTVSPA